MEYCSVTQKSLWREDLPPFVVKLFRRTGQYTASKVLNTFDDAGKYDVAIIPEPMLTPDALNCFIRNPIAPKQIVLFRNRVDKTNFYILEKRCYGNLEVCTYSLTDAKKYRMLYHPQCWNKDLGKGPEEPIVSDLYFVGYAKSRYQDIIAIKDEIVRNHLIADFTVVSKNGEPMTTKYAVPYSECVRRMKRSRAILDIVGADNEGLTYRPLEALFLKKKLVTNFLGLQNYDFFMPNRKNIFLIGVDSLDNLAEFVRAPFVQSEFSMNQYDIADWMESLIRQVE